MNRQQLPLISAESGLRHRPAEIRMPARSQGHDLRNDAEERP